MTDYSKMTYEQKNVVALRNAVMFIASVLSDEQKSRLDLILSSNVDGKIDEEFEAPEAEALKDIYKITQEILAINPKG
ncbi:hypothetical protein [Lonsdalea quercina]|uniref:hypothetical protein n=1 Tax=Lonsdalea quercina TaxID=71657 RepID=UPI0039760B54